MTAQAAEILHYKGRELALCAEPLDLYLENNNIRFDSETIANSGTITICSACWRGYIGEWLIENRRLYLIGINNVNDEPIPLSRIFPDNPKRVFAHWVTGELRCPEGELLTYVHGGYGSAYERDLFLEFCQGKLVAERLVYNGEVPDPDVPTG
jgi:hypothetical protein